MLDDGAIVLSPKDQAMSSSSTDTGEKIQIVIADDHPIVREGLTAILGLQKDFQIVAQAEDGEQACQLCEQLLPTS